MHKNLTNCNYVPNFTACLQNYSFIENYNMLVFVKDSSKITILLVFVKECTCNNEFFWCFCQFLMAAYNAGIGHCVAGDNSREIVLQCPIAYTNYYTAHT